MIRVWSEIDVAVLAATDLVDAATTDQGEI
jgi:hypothetical protein